MSAVSGTADHDDTTLDHALAYARRGWRVIPIPRGRKHPATNGTVHRKTGHHRQRLIRLIINAQHQQALFFVFANRLAIGSKEAVIFIAAIRVDVIPAIPAVPDSRAQLGRLRPLPGR